MSQIQSEIELVLPSLTLPGYLSIPANPLGIVLFAHGSGSSRKSVRNQFVANYLCEEGFATLLFDLLTEIEDRDPAKRFDIPFIVERLLMAIDWTTKQNAIKDLSLALFGASTGAAAALIAAAQLKKKVKAVVSRGGRPDLALPFLKKVTAPTLLIVGGNDFPVVELNQKAYAELSSKKKLEIVPNATHLFEENGALEKVAELSLKWLQDNL